MKLDLPLAKNEFFQVFVRLGKLVVVIVLATTLGTHWALLQTVAWTSMLVDNLHSTSLDEALVKTFDGKHPCPLCVAIAAGKKAEQKKEFTAPTLKLEFPPVAENFVLIAPSQFLLVPQTNTSADSLTQKPPTPPPRGLFI